MTAASPLDLWNAYLEVLADLGRTDPELRLALPLGTSEEGPTPFERAFPDRVLRAKDPSPQSLIQAASLLAAHPRTTFVSIPAQGAAEAYGPIRDLVAYARRNVKVVARFPWPALPTEEGGAPAVEDVGLMRGIPGMTVVVPADAPTARSAIRAVAGIEGPAYVRLAEGDHPVLTDGSFALGRIGTLRDGSDLTIVAAGPILGAVLALTDELQQVGIAVRVLDCASVKPIDAPALLRAARETGALVVVEEHTVETGLGELVAAIVAENVAVPVRRVAVPDLFAAPPGGHGSLGPAADRLRDEAWELLRLRGKVQ